MSNDWRPAIRALVYCVQFDDDPLKSVDHAIRQIVDKKALGLGRDDYKTAIAQALASSDPLARIIPQDHPEDTIRRFLKEVGDKL